MSVISPLLIELFPFMKKTDLCFLLTLALVPFAAPWTLAQDENSASEIAAEETVPVSENATPETPENLPNLRTDKSVPAEMPEMIAVQKEAEAARAKAEKRKADQMALRKLQMEKSKIDAELALEQAKLRQSMEKENDARVRLEAANALRQAKLAAEFSEIDEAKRTLDAVAARDTARDNLKMLDRNSELRERDLDARITRLTQEIELGKYNLELLRSRLENNARDVVTAKADYLKEPFVDGTLYISDRRIDFNGPVTDGLARYVVDRIYFYNNQNSEYPIFIVIDNSPGGSVFAGYQILKAMESSKAPVYVVVKEMAASMAAVITTLAERSFCYESTIILHHQASSGVSGNMTVMDEQYKLTKDWVLRIFDPVCKKTGKTYEEFVKDMYAHFSTGDWAAWGKDAVKMRWADHLADRIVETSVVKKSEPKPKNEWQVIRIGEHKIDERGNAYIELPKPVPGDAWMIYDPQNRYRFAR